MAKPFSRYANAPKPRWCRARELHNAFGRRATALWSVVAQSAARQRVSEGPQLGDGVSSIAARARGKSGRWSDNADPIWMHDSRERARRFRRSPAFGAQDHETRREAHHVNPKGAKKARKNRPKKHRPSDKFRKEPGYNVEPGRYEVRTGMLEPVCPPDVSRLADGCASQGAPSEWTVVGSSPAAPTPKEATVPSA
eukprot:scaffold213_cov245-Pinguiococcus_pyrenoidosus.AAC.47